jgi:MFS family permease
LLGVLLLQWSWRWLFVVNLPLLALLIPQAARCLPAHGAEAVRGLDWRGAALLAVSLGSLALMLNESEAALQGPGEGWLTTLALLLVAVAGLWSFFRVERSALNPVVSPLLMRLPSMRAVSVLALATGFVEATMVFLPTLAVVAFGVTARMASLMLLPLVAALIVGSLVAGRVLDRSGPVIVIRVGVVLIVAGLAILGSRAPSVVTFYGGGLAVGFGLASLLGAPLRFVAQRAAGPGRRGASQGVLTVFLGTGRLAGAAMIGGIVPSGDVETDGYRMAMLLVAAVCALSLTATRWLASDHDRPAGGETR